MGHYSMVMIVCGARSAEVPAHGSLLCGYEKGPAGKACTQMTAAEDKAACSSQALAPAGTQWSPQAVAASVFCILLSTEQEILAGRSPDPG